jgi:hypothetical protein
MRRLLMLCCLALVACGNQVIVLGDGSGSDRPAGGQASGSSSGNDATPDEPPNSGGALRFGRMDDWQSDIESIYIKNDDVFRSANSAPGEGIVASWSRAGDTSASFYTNTDDGQLRGFSDIDDVAAIGDASELTFTSVYIVSDVEVGSVVVYKDAARDLYLAFELNDVRLDDPNEPIGGASASVNYYLVRGGDFSVFAE